MKHVHSGLLDMGVAIHGKDILTWKTKIHPSHLGRFETEWPTRKLCFNHIELQKHKQKHIKQNRDVGYLIFCLHHKSGLDPFSIHPDIGWS